MATQEPAALILYSAQLHQQPVVSVPVPLARLVQRVVLEVEALQGELLALETLHPHLPRKVTTAGWVQVALTLGLALVVVRVALGLTGMVQVERLPQELVHRLA